MYGSKSILTAFFCFLLLGYIFCTPFVGAENIPLTEKEKKSMSGDNIVISNGIAVHVFNFTESDTLESVGYFDVLNPMNHSIAIKLTIDTTLSTVDLDTDKNPRIHKTISKNVYFEEYPYDSWIELSETSFTIDPESKYRVEYSVNPPEGKKAWDIIDGDITKGFLGYINIKDDELANEQATVKVGVNYNYKIFTLFQGAPEEANNPFGGFGIFFILGIAILAIGAVAYLFLHIQHRKRKSEEA